MLDFVTISHSMTKSGCEIIPSFDCRKSKSQDLMIKGGDFYAVWDEDTNMWSTDEDTVIYKVDKMIDDYVEKHRDILNGTIKKMYMWNSSTGSMRKWHSYCQKDSRDHYEILDEKLIFRDDKVSRDDYCSKRLSYNLEEGSTDAWDAIVGTLYSEEEKHKIEWCIGSIVSGDSTFLQKFAVFYGASGAGKSTVLNIIEAMFDGYCASFDAKALGAAKDFSLESFKDGPLVAVQHDGDLSRIEDNTLINSLVSHEKMPVNTKFKSIYTQRFKCFLFMGTNKPVKITDAKSGIIRRLIDISPKTDGTKIPYREYKRLTKQVQFEYGAIANKCMKVYLEDPNYYDDYIPIRMMNASNDFYNFMVEHYSKFLEMNEITMREAWEWYNVYADKANVRYKLSQMVFKEELKNYFLEFKDRASIDGRRVWNYYIGFRTDRFDVEDPSEKRKKQKKEESTSWIVMKEQDSLFDKEFENCLAQYCKEDGTPRQGWANVTTRMKELDSKELHYIKTPPNLIVIDFDLKDDEGNKSAEKNLAAASEWKPTYAEFSKSGAGIHLHYIYEGDVSKLSCVFSPGIEVKVYTGGSALRRKLTQCNDISIATLNSGLPLKKEVKVLDTKVTETEKSLRTTINKCLVKGVHPSTRQNMNYILELLDRAYAANIKYDVSDMYDDIVRFAMQSKKHSSECLDVISKMKLSCEGDLSDKPEAMLDHGEDTVIFLDLEVFPNLLLVNYKVMGEGHKVQRLINPSPKDIARLIEPDADGHYLKIIGFNCREYDNHILYGRYLGYDNAQIYQLSQDIINKVPGSKFGNAYDISYADVYDFASAGNKMSLKKLEFKMGIRHKELGLPWDQPVPEEKWEEVAEYCDNDVIATEAAFNYLSADWTARQILADLAGMNVNSTTNSLTTRIIFGTNRKPQGEFCYRDLSKPVTEIDFDVNEFLEEACPAMMTDHHGSFDTPFNDSILPYFSGYSHEGGKSIYRGEEVGEGGYVYAEPGIYYNVALLDIASMHPHSIIAECLFGPRYTRAFRDIVVGRVNIKHEAWDLVDEMMDGKLRPYVEKVKRGEMSSSQLANALKTAINSVYGLTAASFENPFNDIRNKDNIVAKRGALFMVDLKHEVQKRGFTVAHIKTDSIKIPNATPEIIQFVMDFGKQYGYTFEHEATYDRMCLVNDAVYIAKYKDGKHAGEWTATGKQFQVPYVFKTLFSKEAINFDDVCEVFTVSKGALYLDMNSKLPDVSALEADYDILNKEGTSVSRKQAQLREQYGDDLTELKSRIDAGHDYQFVGRVGQFCPVKGYGGVLYRMNDGKRYAASGSTGFRWVESDILNGEMKDIDYDFYRHLVDDAVATISKYGDFEQFCA